MSTPRTHTSNIQQSPAVAVALAHIEAWSSHDWQKTRELLAPDVHVQVTTTQPGRPEGDLRGVERYMTAKARAALLIEPGSLVVLSAIGDERNALVACTFRIRLGPEGAMVTMGRSCIYLVDDDGKIREERDSFFLFADEPSRGSPAGPPSSVRGAI